MAQRDIRWRLFIAWDGSTYVNESQYMITCTGSYSLNPPGLPSLTGRSVTPECNIVLANTGNRFSPANSTGALYSELVDGAYFQRPMYVEVSIDGGSNYHRVYTGIIDTLQESAVTPGNINTVELRCLGKDALYMNARASTSKAQFATWADSPPTESDVIEQFLSDAGISSGDMDLDTGMFAIPFAWMDDESPIEECWSVAASCMGRFFYDAINDKFTYQNAGRWFRSPYLTASTSAPDNTLDRSTDYQSLSLAWNTQTVYSDVTVEYSGRQVGPSDTIWTPDEDLFIPADDSRVIDVTYRQPAYSVSGTTFHAATAGGADITSDVTAALSSQKAQRATLTLTNTNTTYGAFLHGVRVVGAPVVGGPEGEVTDSSSDSFWTGRADRKRAIRGSMYLQTRTQAESIANMVIASHETPQLTYTIGGVNGDPERNLGDRIELTDSDVLGAATRYGYITAIRWSVGRQGFTQTLTVIDSQSTFPLADATNGYFVIGTHKLGVFPSSDTRRVFY